MALFWRIWIAVTFVNLSVLSIFVALATLQFGNINSGLVGERLIVLANRTAAPFAAAARIGLPLSTVRNAAALLERARQTDDAILAIHVFDKDGRILHSTTTPAPAKLSAEAEAARKAAHGASWDRETTEGFLSGIEIKSKNGTSAGGILVAYPGGGNLTRIQAMAAELALGTVFILLVSGAMSALLLRLGLNRQIRLFEAIDEAITGFERSAWRSAAGGSAVNEQETDDLRHLLVTAEQSYRTIGQELATFREQTE